MDKTDEEIMMQYQLENDEKAAKMIYFRYKTRILNFTLRIMGNRADAEDVTGDVFLALFSKKYSCDSKAKFSTWLYTVARNSCISQLRKKKGIVSLWFSSRGSDKYESWEVEDPQDISGQMLEKKEEAEHVRRAIDRLPYEQREAIVLREYQCLSYDEISQILSCTLEKVKILIFRGRERLKNELASFIKEGE